MPLRKSNVYFNRIYDKNQNINDFKAELKIKEQKMHDNILALCELGAQNQKLQVCIIYYQEISSSLLGKTWKNESLIDKCELCSKNFTLTIRKVYFLFILAPLQSMRVILFLIKRRFLWNM